jgi:FtsZ-interacting cell division protein YlmF
MDTFETDPALFSKANAGDETLFVIFYMGVLKNDARSTDEGRAIFDDVECVRIIVPGDKNNVIDRPADANDKRRFAKQYGLFKQGVAEEDQVSGTRLTDWPFLSRAQCEELRHLSIKTVEQLAHVRDDITTKVPGLVSLKQNATVWLAKASKSAEAAQITKRLQDQDAEIADLKRVLQEQAGRIEKLLTKAQA